MQFLLGTFNTPRLYTIEFRPPLDSSSAQLDIIKQHEAISGHSWLSLSKDERFLYATAWTKPQSAIAAYKIEEGGKSIQLPNTKQTKSLSGYVCCNETHVFSAGGPSGEVFLLERDGSIGNLVQEMDFETGQGENLSKKAGDLPYGDYGGLRHGAHSIHLSPDGRSVYVADIGRNAIWSFKVDTSKDLNMPVLTRGSKYSCPRVNDGPRHTWPHPNGKVLYALQEHTGMVDAFSISSDGLVLEQRQGVKIMPVDKDPKLFWADEVRVSTGPDPMRPRYMYASARGLSYGTKGYVAVFALEEDGMFASEEAIHIWQTPTSGGAANAVEPAPWQANPRHGEYLSLTDSEEGWVSVLSFDGSRLRELARVSLGRTEKGDIVGAATAVWLRSNTK